MENTNTPTSVKSVKPIHAKPSLYAYYFEGLKSIAKDHGYNIVVHGSMNRDLDLIAIPWTDNPKDEFEMINAFSEYMNGWKSDNKGDFLNTTLPGGRKSYVLQLNRGGYQNLGHGLGHEDQPEYMPDPQYYIDISVTPIKKASPKKICYCGSLRVALEAFKKAEYQSVIDGNIALLPCCMFVDIQREYGAESDYKQKADELHKRKIDICDEVFVLNVGGYIGESTRSEINYALSIGKPVFYLETTNENGE